MRTPRLPSWLYFVIGLLGALTADANPARACPARCGPGVRLFAEGVYVPGDRVYLKALVDDPGFLSLKTEDGKDIPANIRMIGPDRVYAPIDPIPANTMVVLTYTSMACGGNRVSNTTRFLAREPLESRVGDGKLTTYEYGLVSGKSEFDSLNVGPVAFQRIKYTAPDAAGALDHLTDMTVTFDDRQFGLSYPVPWSAPIEIYAMCTAVDPIPQPPPACGGTLYGPGRHVIKAQPHIVGQPDPAPTSLEIDLDIACSIGRAGTSAAARTDAGTSHTGSAGALANAGALATAGVGTLPTAGAEPTAPSVAGTSSLDHGQAGSSSPTRAPSSASGCTAAVGGAGGGAAWFVLLVLICLRRRRSAAGAG